MKFKVFLRSFFLQALWNFQSMQALGFLYVLKPFLEKLYSKEEEKREARKKSKETLQTEEEEREIQ